VLTRLYAVVHAKQVTEQERKLGAMWKEASDEDKKKYQDMAVHEKARYIVAVQREHAAEVEACELAAEGLSEHSAPPAEMQSANPLKRQREAATSECNSDGGKEDGEDVEDSEKGLPDATAREGQQGAAAAKRPCLDGRRNPKLQHASEIEPPVDSPLPQPQANPSSAPNGLAGCVVS
jgi:hypothetical protein